MTALVASYSLGRASGTKIGARAVGIVIGVTLLLQSCLLLYLLLTSKRELKLIPTDENSEERQIKSNIEIPGTDCKVTTDNINITLISGHCFFPHHTICYFDHRCLHVSHSKWTVCWEQKLLFYQSRCRLYRGPPVCEHRCVQDIFPHTKSNGNSFNKEPLCARVRPQNYTPMVMDRGC
ncbi:uncharacterized protein LOC118359645 isoform X3 [Oncorhynchus keta]|uniref:uncharacterized protein LOC118359645 isoform X3 n=1 Tax=Oncorhynchus keta TaxID=8018 RepID=UPI00227C742D|nr:uncharacterized protein LOC118359645 isoform X3 [Oncorhynchus keta]